MSLSLSLTLFLKIAERKMEEEGKWSQGKVVMAPSLYSEMGWPNYFAKLT